MRESKWNSKGGGMSKHRKSGVSHNHAHTIALNREAAKKAEQDAEIARKRKGKLFNSVSDVFKGL